MLTNLRVCLFYTIICQKYPVFPYWLSCKWLQNICFSKWNNKEDLVSWFDFESLQENKKRCTALSIYVLSKNETSIYFFKKVKNMLYKTTKKRFKLWLPGCLKIKFKKYLCLVIDTYQCKEESLQEKEERRTPKSTWTQRGGGQGQRLAVGGETNPSINCRKEDHIEKTDAPRFGSRSQCQPNSFSFLNEYDTQASTRSCARGSTELIYHWST